ncbi:hypothetical protein QUF72_14250 [Desulfobacterales bacterium HSG2]|nr:hypothetical protein [Desulfobacterales bacterium HSG2]
MNNSDYNGFREAREYDNGFRDETDITGSDMTSVSGDETDIPGSDMTADSGDETDISVSSFYPLSYSRDSPKSVIIRNNLISQYQDIKGLREKIGRL